MIPVGLESIAFLYVAGATLVIAATWMACGWGRSRAARRRRRQCIQCALCGTEYENSSDTELPACPACSHPNERTAPQLF